MEKLDSAQLAQLKEIGAQLRQVRQEQSRSLGEIAAKTCIRLPLLQAIEEGEGQALPEPVFVQGFIRRYGDILGLDGTSLARSFPINRGMITSRESSVRPVAPPAKPAAAPDYAAFSINKPQELKPALGRQVQDMRSSLHAARLPLQSKAGYILCAVVSAFALIGIVLSFLKPNSPPQTAAVPASPIASAPSPASSPDPSPASSSTDTPQSASPAVPSVAPAATSSEPSPASPSANAPVSARVNLTDAAWMQVIVDGKVDYEGTLPKGTQRDWLAKREIVLLSGNAGAVSVSANAGAPTPMGALGTVQELTIRAKN